MDHGIGSDAVPAQATGLGQEQEQRHLVLLELPHPSGAIAGFAGERDVADVAATKLTAELRN